MSFPTNKISLKFRWPHGIAWSSESVWVGIVMLMAFISRLAALPFSDVVDSDGVSRVFIGEAWQLDFSWISSGVWGPLHAYLNGITIYLFNDRVVAPIVLHILMSTATVLPIYGFSKNIYHRENAAFVIAILFAFNPLLFRNSLMPMSEIPFLFFVASSLYFLSRKGSTSKKHWSAIFAGICITLACALRYEGWVLIGLFALALAIQKKWKQALLFLPVASVFPLIWMAGNYEQFGNALYGIEYSTGKNTNGWWSQFLDLEYYKKIIFSPSKLYTIDSPELSPETARIEGLKRILFYPLSIFYVYPLGGAYVVVLVAFFKTIRKKVKRETWTWFIPFFVLLSIYIFKANQGTLLLQHRFSMLLFTLLVPFTGLFIKSSWSRKWVIGGALLVAGLHFYLASTFRSSAYLEKVLPQSELKRVVSDLRFYTFNQLTPIPKLTSTQSGELSALCKPYLKKNTPLVLDFFGWESTYHFALHSGVRAEWIVFLVADVIENDRSFKQLDRYINYPGADNTGILVIRQESANSSLIQNPDDKPYIQVNGSIIPISLKESEGNTMIFTFETQKIINAFQ